MAGPGHAFEGRDGLFENVTGPFTLADFPTEGGPSLTPRVQLKYWPVEANGQPVVWAALDLRKSVAPADIKEIEVFTNKFTWFEIGSEPEKWDPQTRETADHSLPYIFARTLVDGPITTRSYTDDKVRDPALRPLMSKIKVTVDDALEAMRAADGDAGGRDDGRRQAAFGRDRRPERPGREPDAGRRHRGEVQRDGRAGARAGAVPPGARCLVAPARRGQCRPLVGLLDLKPRAA